jgi:hypothetical protein
MKILKFLTIISITLLFFSNKNHDPIDLDASKSKDKSKSSSLLKFFDNLLNKKRDNKKIKTENKKLKNQIKLESRKIQNSNSNSNSNISKTKKIKSQIKMDKQSKNNKNMRRIKHDKTQNQKLHLEKRGQSRFEPSSKKTGRTRDGKRCPNFPKKCKPKDRR